MAGYMLFKRPIIEGQATDPQTQMEALERMLEEACEICGRIRREHRLDELKLCIEKKWEQLER
jgi:hypothetical protein